MNFPFWRSPFQRAIERGLANGKLSDELSDLGDYKVTSKRDAKAVCKALGVLRTKHAANVEYEGQIRSLAGVFQEVDPSAKACDVLMEDGIPELLKIVDTLQSDKSGFGGAFMFCLKILAMYGTADGASKVIEYALSGVQTEGYMWKVVFGNFSAAHPESARFFAALSNPLPKGFMAVGLLDAANAALIGGASFNHPFDSEDGHKKLEQWLRDCDEESFSYAHSTAAALPFIDSDARDSLLDIASKHPNSSVRVEAAWAAAKCGGKNGFDRLVGYCLDWRTAAVAARYLGELGKEELVPKSARELEFMAVSAFAEWLAHPNELGKYPEELAVVDRRTLRWPPSCEAKPFWLIKYTNKAASALNDDESEYGLVGSVVFCFFSYRLVERPPEDGYAIHCYWEMQQGKLIQESYVGDNTGEYSTILQQWTHGELSGARVLYIVECDPELKMSQRVVGLASACLNGRVGWVVLDGKSSMFYPKDEMPQDSHSAIPLKIHIGRKLLGFPLAAERKSFLAVPQPAKDQGEIVSAYRALLRRSLKLEGKKHEKAFDAYSDLCRKFEMFSEACFKCEYLDALEETISTLMPLWNHDKGMMLLGEVAFQAGLFSKSENILKQLREKDSHAYHGRPMILLATILDKKGDKESAKSLIWECLIKLQTNFDAADSDGKKNLAQDYNNKVEMLRVIDADRTDEELEARSLPKVL